MRITTWLKKAIIGSPFEGVARRVHRWVHNRFLDDPVNARYNRQTITIMKRILNKDSNCVDVGSSAGDLLQEMVRLAPAGTHYAFEPIPSLYQRLTELYPKVRSYNVALSDTAEDTTFHHVISHPGYSGFQRRDYPTQHETVDEISVRTDLLDNIIPDDLPIHFIKVDVEGAELQVLRGAVDTIRRNRPVIVFEHQLGAADAYGTKPEEVYELLTTKCNLHVSLMQSWLMSKAPLDKEQFAEQFYQRANYMFVAHP